MKNITINLKSHIHDGIQINVDDNANMVIVDSIELHSSGKISAVKNNNKVPLIIHNVTVEPQTLSELSDLEISNEFDFTISIVEIW